MTINRKKERFQRLVERRMTNVLTQLRLIGNLSNRSVYEYTESEKQQVFQALDRELRDLKSKFNSRQTTKDKNEFKLS
tara:strand:- start:121 stop:354 length:234 start_codon:yes stop_codon:yes gene_type:complete